MRYLSIIVVFLNAYFLVSTAHSKPLQTAPQRRIVYSRSVPAFVLREMPKTGRSLFWGKLAQKHNPSLLGFHFIALQASELEYDLAGAKCHFALDIFSLSSPPRRLNRILVNYRYAWPPNLFGMKLTWLDSHTKTVPILVIQSFIPGSYGYLGLEHVVAFPQGWTNNATVNNLNFGSWKASDTGGQTNDILIGPKGMTEIHAALFPFAIGTPEELAHDYTFTLRWKEEPPPGFVPEAAAEEVLESYYYPYQQ